MTTENKITPPAIEATGKKPTIESSLAAAGLTQDYAPHLTPYPNEDLPLLMARVKELDSCSSLTLEQKFSVLARRDYCSFSTITMHVRLHELGEAFNLTLDEISAIVSIATDRFQQVVGRPRDCYRYRYDYGYEKELETRKSCDAYLEQLNELLVKVRDAPISKDLTIEADKKRRFVRLLLIQEGECFPPFRQDRSGRVNPIILKGLLPFYKAGLFTGAADKKNVASLEDNGLGSVTGDDLAVKLEVGGVLSEPDSAQMCFDFIVDGYGAEWLIEMMQERGLLAGSAGKNNLQQLKDNKNSLNAITHLLALLVTARSECSAQENFDSTIDLIRRPPSLKVAGNPTEASVLTTALGAATQVAGGGWLTTKTEKRARIETFHAFLMHKLHNDRWRQGLGNLTPKEKVTVDKALKELLLFLSKQPPVAAITHEAKASPATASPGPGPVAAPSGSGQPGALETKKSSATPIVSQATASLAVSTPKAPGPRSNSFLPTPRSMPTDSIELLEVRDPSTGSDLHLESPPTHDSH